MRRLITHQQIYCIFTDCYEHPEVYYPNSESGNVNLGKAIKTVDYFECCFRCYLKNETCIGIDFNRKDENSGKNMNIDLFIDPPPLQSVVTTSLCVLCLCQMKLNMTTPKDIPSGEIWHSGHKPEMEVVTNMERRLNLLKAGLIEKTKWD